MTRARQDGQAGRSVLVVGRCGGLGPDCGRLLAGGQLELRAASTAAEGLRQHRALPADLIVVDLDLPDGTAEQFCEAVRSDELLRNVSVLVLCDGSETARQRAAECRANAHLVTPVDREALARLVVPLLRVSSRASYRVLVRVETGGRAFFCTSANVSASGILLETAEDLQSGQEMGCSFFLPGKVRVQGGGRIVREGETEHGRHFGVQFVDIPEGDVAGIERFVADWTRPR